MARASRHGLCSMPFGFRIESFDSAHGADPCHLVVFPIPSPLIPPHLSRGEDTRAGSLSTFLYTAWSR